MLGNFTPFWETTEALGRRLSLLTQEVDFTRLGWEHESGPALILFLQDVNVNSQSGLPGRVSAS